MKSIEPDFEMKGKIKERINSEGSNLNMESWHHCNTTHCLAGWAVTLHPKGEQLEEASSTYLAGRLILGLDHKEADIFFQGEEEAMEWLEK